VARMTPPMAALGHLDGVSQGMAVPRMGWSALLMSKPASVVTRLRPPHLLAYLNPSARSTRSSAVSVDAAIVTPTETVTRTWTSPFWTRSSPPACKPARRWRAGRSGQFRATGPETPHRPPHRDVTASQPVHHWLGDHAQYLIAGLVPERVVDILEVVRIDVQHAERGGLLGDRPDQGVRCSSPTWRGARPATVSTELSLRSRRWPA
jgi:hypothetical protein